MKRLLMVLFVALMVCACTGEFSGIVRSDQAELSIDSLLGVIDTLRIRLGRHSCIIDCLRETLDSLDVMPHCECGR